MVKAKDAVVSKTKVWKNTSNSYKKRKCNEDLRVSAVKEKYKRPQKQISFEMS